MQFNMEQTGKLPQRDIYRENLGKAFRHYLLPYFSPGQEYTKALSIGCNFAYEAAPLVQLSPGMSFRGIDISDDAILAAKETNADLADRAEFIVADARLDSAFGEDPWDIVVIRNPQILGSQVERDPGKRVTTLDWQTIIGNSVKHLSPRGLIFITTELEEEKGVITDLLSADHKQVGLIRATKNDYPTSSGIFRDNFVIVGRRVG